MQISIRELTVKYPSISYTTLQGRISGQVQGYDHASGGKWRARVLPKAVEGKTFRSIYLMSFPLLETRSVMV